MAQSVGAVTRLPDGRPRKCISIPDTHNIYFCSAKPPDWSKELGVSVGTVDTQLYLRSTVRINFLVPELFF